VKLGRRYGLTPGDLARINRFSYNTELHEGDRIVVYSPTGDAPHERTMGMTPSTKRPERGAVSTPARAADAAGKKKPTTTIAKADTKATAKPAVKVEKTPDKNAKNEKNAKSAKPADKPGSKKK
jgi:hypothetical protein